MGEQDNNADSTLKLFIVWIRVRAFATRFFL